MPQQAATLDELLKPLRDAPDRSAVLLDVDGVLAPIVQHAEDAHMPETTRRPLIEVGHVVAHVERGREILVAQEVHDAHALVELQRRADLQHLAAPVRDEAGLHWRGTPDEDEAHAAAASRRTRRG